MADWQAYALPVGLLVVLLSLYVYRAIVGPGARPGARKAKTAPAGNPSPIFMNTKTATGRFTRAEVAKHDNEKDLWIIIKQKVYDVTAFIDEHPGGKSILAHPGGDVTAGFFGPQHPSRTHTMVEEFFIGELVEEGAKGAAGKEDAAAGQS